MWTKRKSSVDGDPEKSRTWIAVERLVEQVEAGLKNVLRAIHQKEGGFTFSGIQRKTPVLRPMLQSSQGSLCGLLSSRYGGPGEPNGQVVSINRAAEGGKYNRRKIGNKNRQNGQEEIPPKLSSRPEKSEF